jgi:hypothetical protein
MIFRSIQLCFCMIFDSIHLYILSTSRGATLMTAGTAENRPYAGKISASPSPPCGRGNLSHMKFPSTQSAWYKIGKAEPHVIMLD